VKAVQSPSSPPSSKTRAAVTASSAAPTSKPAEGAQPSAPFPDDLKNEAYDYYGLANNKPMDLELKDNLSPTITSGTQLVTFESFSNGVAKFKIEHTGNLSPMGTEEVGLSKDGVTVLKGPEG
jgi:hypothetical protein